MTLKNNSLPNSNYSPVRYELSIKMANINILAFWYIGIYFLGVVFYYIGFEHPEVLLSNYYKDIYKIQLCYFIIQYLSYLWMNMLQITNSVRQVLKVSCNVLNSYKYSMLAYPGHIFWNVTYNVYFLLFTE